MKYYIIAGEASGDLHGSHLIKELKLADPGADIRCWGGDKMQAAGGKVVKHIKDLAFMGFFEVLKHLGTILRNIEFCKKDILEYKPDVVILIDYPGFNFRLFKFLKQNHFRIFYYISPQLWAWKTSRVYKVQEYVERMFVIFPFEKAFYEKYNVAVDYVGHPLLDELKPEKNAAIVTDKTEKVIAILPGSRKQEISYLLPEYLKVIDSFPDYKFEVAGLSNIGSEFYQKLIGNARCTVVFDQTYKLLERSTAAIVTSGTATLETALHNVPEVISYKGSWISYYIAKSLIKNISYICIVNLICGKRVVEELIQADVNKERLIAEVKNILSLEGRETILQGYDFLRSKLGVGGASKRVATLMIGYLKSGK
ncbi:MAG: putative lipid-A-disaccharide synthase [Bacteroidota bacterium]|nr:putative lipid-A-disaccharide synthase [Bacteroidota bacterium]